MAEKLIKWACVGLVLALCSIGWLVVLYAVWFVVSLAE